ncbi:hypothetical protein [Arthrobacter bambusae]|uniref:hypothetical protein n=1 Tax=Arthrobacter bambusae TaxID=1338426 RepID=UPI002783ACCD|nr:hypothetical protein [Arthrobacter bambusae]MDQ0211380.1 hypothetical protein [Arthrobacter bambusae]MDQ0235694.1 hypothetical protein [Arthrobacter bambusae]
MTEKIRLLVKMDIDGAQVRIEAHGRLNTRSLRALYVVVRCANALMLGLGLEVDVTGASVDLQTMEGLRRCSQSHHLPALIDPQQSEFNISVRSSADAAMAA